MKSTGVRGLLAAILLLVPACWTGIAGIRMWLAAWSVAAAEEEPLVVAVTGARSDLRDALATATDRAPANALYPLRLSEGERSPDATESDLLSARGHLIEAARRRPTDGETRFHLSGVAQRLSMVEEADEQARAALLLMPLHQDIRGRVGRYFNARYKQTRDPEHLMLAVRALRGTRGELIVLILGDPLLKREQLTKAFDAAELPIAKRIEYLERSGRWEWTLLLAREEDRRQGDDSKVEGAVRLRLARFLLSTGRREPGFAQVLAARENLGGTVPDELLLGRALLGTGARAEGLERLRKHLDATGRVDATAAALIADRAAPAARVELFQGLVDERKGGDRAVLALGVALIDAGRLNEAHQMLAELTKRRAAGAEAAFALGVAHRRGGDSSIALRYAQRAVELDRNNREYRRLLRSLEGKKERK